MEISFLLNQKPVTAKIEGHTLLLDLLRQLGCYSVKRGCETANCGLCTVLVDGAPQLSCGFLAARADGRSVTTLEGEQAEAGRFGGILASYGAEQCGFCSPGFMLTVIAMKRELHHPDEEQIAHYLAGNLCRCTGYMGQMRAIRDYLEVNTDEGDL